MCKNRKKYEAIKPHWNVRCMFCLLPSFLGIHTKLSIPMTAPTIFFAVLLSIMNSFRIFKESYLYYGSKYPPDHGYTLQFYLNSNFLKFDYQKLASS